MSTSGSEAPDAWYRGPTVDVIIPVHSESRPIAHAVASVLADVHPGVRVLVVCHNLAAARIESRLADLASHPRLRLIECHDGIPSPAGPRNAGIAASTADLTRAT